MLIAVPLTTWSALKWMQATPWISATKTPAAMAAARPTHGLPVK